VHSIYKFFATCSKGLEYLLVDELKSLGATDAREALAGVHFSGNIELAYRACLWSRLASRILLKFSEFDARDKNDLYNGTYSIDWKEHLNPQDSLAIDAVGQNEALRHGQFIAQCVKDAIVDQLRANTGIRPTIDLEKPSIRINVLLKHQRAVVSLDFSGTPLHQRGYRQGTGIAPLKENLACAMLLRAGWPQIFAHGGGIVDPLCGSGTLLIEAALMAADVAPGLKRSYFGFLGWKQHNDLLWKKLKNEAFSRADTGLKHLQVPIFGFDQDPIVLGEAKRNSQAAEVSGFIRFGRQSLDYLKRPHECNVPGLIICNPPYGERMSTDSSLLHLYRQLGERFKTEFVGWKASLITSDPELGKATGLHARKKYKFYNGAIECTFLNFDLTPQESSVPRTPKPLSAGAEMLRNRLQKNLRHLRKICERENVSCFRVYDADLPEYAAAIDMYENHLHIQEYQAPASIAEETARQRMSEIVRAAGDVFGLSREQINIKTRRRGKGGEKYGRLSAQAEFIQVHEGGLKFLVNLTDYLDTGLFLDHRPLRTYIRAQSKGKRFLNLFCYTGTASVYAAAGGASSTTNVDLSATYLNWAAKNLSLNGFHGRQHELIQVDSREWLAQTREHYDLIYVDPPTFSNSKRAEDFDIQKDYVELIKLCLFHLKNSGKIIFSNNFRRFKFDMTAFANCEINDITPLTIGFDFARNPRIHQCWEIGHKKHRRNIDEPV